MQQVARALQCHEETVRQKIASGRLKAFNIGTDERPAWRIEREDFAAFLRASGAAPATVSRILGNGQ